ncbi:uncharacterized protein PG998_005677 [Apiospora kogelbergensis]|uniref:uncharacterized protein n=1 Tax=Apiospora kogelbergensis TaxID=1337665 RepID=UPI00313120F4
MQSDKNQERVDSDSVVAGSNQPSSPAGTSEKRPATPPVDDSIDPANEVQGTKLILIHTALCLCTFLVGLDFNLVAVAIPVITAEFNSIQDVGWYGAAFQLALCSTQSLAGKTYVLLCALAPSTQALIVGRTITGVGASGIFAGGLTILTTIVPLHKRSIFTGTINSTFAIASIVGPVLGGALTEYITWRWCFYINLPIGGFAGLVCAVLLRLQPAQTERAPLAKKLKGLDGLGFLLFAAALTMLLFAFQWGGVRYAWKSATVIGLLVGSVATACLFACWQLYLQDDALIPPSLFKTHRNIPLVVASAFFLNGPFQAVIYWLPVWFQATCGLSPVQSGTYYLPTVISDVLAAFISAGVVMKIGYWNPLLLAAEVFASLGGGLLSTLRLNSSMGKIIGYQIFGGVGYSMATTMMHVAVQASLPKEIAPLGATTLLTFVSVSCTIFLGLGQLVFQARLTDNLSSVVSPDVVDRIISAGATNLASVVDKGVLPVVIEKYGESATQVFYITAAAPVISFFLVLCCKWTSTKTASLKKAETPV